MDQLYRQYGDIYTLHLGIVLSWAAIYTVYKNNPVLDSASITFLDIC